MSKLAADGIPTAVSLRALLLPRQPSYRWRHQQVTTAELIEAYLANALLDAHRKDPELQKNVSGRKRWRTREELRITIITRIERTYHRRRRQARLGLSTSIEYGTIMNPVALAACPVTFSAAPGSSRMSRCRPAGPRHDRCPQSHS